MAGLNAKCYYYTVIIEARTARIELFQSDIFAVS
jgi:hypothetical protein